MATFHKRANLLVLGLALAVSGSDSRFVLLPRKRISAMQFLTLQLPSTRSLFSSIKKKKKKGGFNNGQR